MLMATVQEAAKEAAKDHGLSDDEEEEEEGTIRQVMPGETAAAAMAAQAAAANAQLPTTVCLIPEKPLVSTLRQSWACPLAAYCTLIQFTLQLTIALPSWMHTLSGVRSGHL